MYLQDLSSLESFAMAFAHVALSCQLQDPFTRLLWMLLDHAYHASDKRRVAWNSIG